MKKLFTCCPLLVLTITLLLLDACAPLQPQRLEPTRTSDILPTMTRPAAISTRAPAMVPTLTRPAAELTQAPGISLMLLDAGKTIYMQKGETLKLTLEGNPSTGYTWEILPPENAILAQVGETEYLPANNLLGAPASLVMLFQANSDGQQDLKLIYHRSWEKNVPPMNSFDVTVVVGRKAENPAPGQISGPLAETAVIPTTVAYPPNGIKGWQTYTNAAYGFSFQYPPKWELERAGGTMAGHAVLLLPDASKKVILQVAFKRANEDTRIGRTGVGSGDLIQMGKVLLVGQEIDRQVLVWQGKHMTVRYICNGCMRRGGLDFGFDLDYHGNWDDPAALPADVEAQADLVVASLRLIE